MAKQIKKLEETRKVKSKNGAVIDTFEGTPAGSFQTNVPQDPESVLNRRNAFRQRISQKYNVSLQPITNTKPVAPPKPGSTFDQLYTLANQKYDQALQRGKERRATQQALNQYDMRPSYMRQQGQSAVPQSQVSMNSLLQTGRRGSNAEGATNRAVTMQEYVDTINKARNSNMEEFYSAAARGQQKTRNALDEKDVIQGFRSAAGGGSSGEVQNSMLTNDQKANYYYLAGTQGKEAAENYRQYVIEQEGINETIAKQNYEAMDKARGEKPGLKDIPFDTAVQLTLGAGQAVRDMSRVPDAIQGKTNVRATGVGEYLSRDMINDVDTSTGSGKAYQTWQKLMNNFGNNAVSMAAGTVFGGPVGSTMFAMQALGSAYQDVINNGGTVQQAQNYAMLQAGDELVTNALLGGISAYGGGLATKALGNTSLARNLGGMIRGAFANNPVGRKIAMGAVERLADGGSEAAQEYLQYFTERFEKWLATGEVPSYTIDGRQYTYDELVQERGTMGAIASILSNEEAAEAAFLGFANAGIMNGLTDVGNTMTTLQLGNMATPDAYAGLADTVNPNILQYRSEDTYQKGKALQEYARDQIRRVEFGKGDSLSSRYGRGLMLQAAEDYQNAVAKTEMDNDYNDAQMLREFYDRTYGKKPVNQDSAAKRYIQARQGQADIQAPQAAQAEGVQSIVLTPEMKEQGTTDILTNRDAARITWSTESGTSEMVRENDGTYTLTNAQGDSVNMDAEQAADALPIGTEINIESSRTEAPAVQTEAVQEGAVQEETVPQEVSSASAEPVQAVSKTKVEESPTTQEKPQKQAPASYREQMLTAMQSAPLQASLSAKENTSVAEELAGGFGESGKALFKQMTPKDAVKNYKAFAAAYNYGKWGGELPNSVRTLLTTDQMTKAMRAGAEDMNRAFPQNTVSTITKAAGRVRVNGVTKGNNNKKNINYDGLTAQQKLRVDVFGTLLSDAMGFDVEWFESKAKNGTYAADVNGAYYTENGRPTIMLDVNAGMNTASDWTGEVTDIQTMLPVIAHEMTHWMEDQFPDLYKEIQTAVINTLAKDAKYTRGLTINQVIDAERKRMDLTEKTRNGEPIVHTNEDAIHEIVARACEDMMRGNKAAMEVFEDLDADQKQTIWNHVKKVFKNIRDFFNQILNNYESRSDEAKAIRRNMEAFNRVQEMWRKALDGTAMEAQEGNIAKPTADIASDPTAQFAEENNSRVEEFSIRQLAQAAGYDIVLTNGKGKGRVPYAIIDTKTGKKLTKNEITPEVVKRTPMGKLIDAAVENGTVSEKVAETQREMFAGLFQLIYEYKDAATVWEIASTVMYSGRDDKGNRTLAGAIKSNSDPQYGTTIDFGTICAKTQAIIDTMSETMLEKGRGLTRNEIIEIVYPRTSETGLSVPCPVCYVFSRWLGVPSLLNTMLNAQERFKNATDDEINAYVSSVEKKYGDSKKRSRKKSGFSKSLATAQKNVGIAMGKIESGKLTAKQVASEKKKIDTNLAKIRQYESQLNELEYYNWVTQVLCETDSKRNPIRDGSGRVHRDPDFDRMIMGEDGKMVASPNRGYVDPKVLLDMRKTGDFAEFSPKAWLFRTTRGAGMGKAIMPHSGETLGDIVKGSNSSSPLRYFDESNPFYNAASDDAEVAKAGMKDASDAVKRAIIRAKGQNLIGGLRLQSTSDFRAEWGIDYMMAFFEMQAIGSQGQLYTKVIEAVDLFASAGIETNLSIMGKGDGYHKDKHGNLVLDFSNVTGIDFDQAYEKTKQYDNVQMILVGLNNTHIRLAMADDRIGFIIPWHSSGSSEKILGSLMKGVNETLGTGTDYSDYQNDIIINEKDKADVRQLRLDILMGEFRDRGKDTRTLTTEEEAILSENKWLADLYHKFYEDESAKEYGIVLNKDQAEHIFPYEYWDTSLTIEDADENGRRFCEYCASLGIAPRFSGHYTGKKGQPIQYSKDMDFTGDKGYWKVLIDRRMYNRDGTYHDPKAVDVTNIKINNVKVPRQVNSNSYNDKTKIGAAVQNILNDLQALEDAPNDLTVSDGVSEATKVQNSARVDVEEAANDPENPNVIREGSDKDIQFSSRFADKDLDDRLRVNMATFFSGAGTVDFALRNLVNHAFAVEYDAKIAAVYKANNGDNIYVDDVRNVNINPYKGKVEYFHASPVCKNYSGANNDAGEVPLDIETAEATARAIKKLNPKVVTVENVARYKNSEAIKIIENALEENGYTFDKEVYDASDFGGATSRKRMFLRAVKDGGVLPDVNVSKSEAKTWYEVVEDLIPSLEEEYLSNYMEERLEPSGIDPDNLSEPILILGGNKAKKLTFARADQPSPTVLANSSEARIMMPDGRVLRATPRVLARIQGLPDEFDLKDGKGGLTNAYKVVGNGVPVQLTQSIVGPLLEENLVKQKSAETGVNYSQRNVDLDARLQELAEKYGAIPKGEKAVREVAVPMQTSDGKNTRRFVRTILESGVTSDMIDERIKKEIIDESLSYEPVTDKDAAEYAASVIRIGGVRRAQREWDNARRNSNFTKDDMALGQFLLKEYAKENDVDNAMNMIEELAAEATRAGQTVQACRMLKKYATQVPAIGLGYIQKTVDQMNLEAKRKMGKKYREMKIDPRLAAEYVKAQTRDEIDAALAKIYINLGSQVQKTIPEEIVDRLRTWRYMSMLGNLRTHIRNLTGNALFVPAVTMKNAIGASIETAVKTETRTKTFRISKEAKAFAAKDAIAMKDVLTGEGDKTVRQLILDQRKVFTTEALNKMSKFNSEKLEQEDWIFLRRHYENSMGQYITANGIDTAHIDPSVLARARKYAVEEAKKATYRDASRLATWLNQSKGAGVIVKYMMEGMLPFKKTPTNILKRGVEYSPAGLLKTLTKGTYELNKGKISVNEYIDGVSSGLTGTAILGVGMALASMGAILGGYRDDDDKDIKKLKGIQEYAVQIGNKTYTIDWAAPGSLPLFVGVELMNALQSERPMNFSDLTNAAIRLIDPMINMSMLSGLNDTLEAISYSDDKLSTLTMETFYNLLGQYVPTLFGQVARTADTTRRANYQDMNKGLPKNMLYFIEKMQNKIPFLTFSNDPYLNEWGEEEKDPRWQAALENFISPGYVSTVRNDKVTSEIERLNQEQDEVNVIPKKMPKYLGKGDERIDLTSAQYTEFQRTAGQMSYNILDAMVDDPRYNGLDSLQQANAIKMAYDYGKAIGRKAIQPEYELTDKPKKIHGMVGSGMQAYDAILTTLAAQNIQDNAEYDKENGVTQKSATIDDILKASGTQEDKGKMYASLYPSDGLTKWEESGGSPYDYLMGQKLSSEIPSDAEDYAYVVNAKNYTGKQKTAWLMSQTAITKSKGYTKWKGPKVKGSDWDFIKIKADLNRFSGKGKKDKIRKYILNQTSNSNRREAMWAMAYPSDSIESLYKETD